MKHKISPLILIFSLIFAASAGAAISLGVAKAQGLVGEQPSGYLGIVAQATPELKQLVKDINNKRRVAYEKIAQRNGTDVKAVEQIAGQKAIAKTLAGHYVKSTSGQWVKVQ